MNIVHKQNGFSMLEALITLVIVSIGLLGIAGIIAHSLKVNQGAQVRSQASWLANDIIDRMRANRATAAGGAYELAECDAAPAAGGSVAGDDLNDWCLALAAALPAGTGAVNIAGNLVTVTVVWDDSRVAGGSANQQFIVETRL